MLANQGHRMSILRLDGTKLLDQDFAFITRQGGDGTFFAQQQNDSKAWVRIDSQGKVTPLPGLYSEVLPSLSSGLIPVREP